MNTYNADTKPDTQWMVVNIGNIRGGYFTILGYQHHFNAPKEDG